MSIKVFCKLDCANEAGDSKCKDYKYNGDCENLHNLFLQKWMKTNCKKACGHCNAVRNTVRTAPS